MAMIHLALDTTRCATRYPQAAHAAEQRASGSGSVRRVAEDAAAMAAATVNWAASAVQVGQVAIYH
jgi:hypothetical protein